MKKRVLGPAVAESPAAVFGVSVTIAPWRTANIFVPSHTAFHRKRSFSAVSAAGGPKIAKGSRVPHGWNWESSPTRR